MELLIGHRADVDAIVLELQDPDDLTRLAVRAHHLDANTLRNALDTMNLGTLADQDSAWIQIAALHDLVARVATSPDWESRWITMIDYAATSGWVSEDGLQVRAHCVWDAR